MKIEVIMSDMLKTVVNIHNKVCVFQLFVKSESDFRDKFRELISQTEDRIAKNFNGEKEFYSTGDFLLLPIGHRGMRFTVCEYKKQGGDLMIGGCGKVDNVLFDYADYQISNISVPECQQK